MELNEGRQQDMNYVYETGVMLRQWMLRTRFPKDMYDNLDLLCVFSGRVLTEYIDDCRPLVLGWEEMRRTHDEWQDHIVTNEMMHEFASLIERVLQLAEMPRHRANLLILPGHFVQRCMGPASTLRISDEAYSPLLWFPRLIGWGVEATMDDDMIAPWIQLQSAARNENDVLNPSSEGTTEIMRLSNAMERYVEARVAFWQEEFYHNPLLIEHAIGARDTTLGQRFTGYLNKLIRNDTFIPELYHGTSARSLFLDIVDIVFDPVHQAPIDAPYTDREKQLLKEHADTLSSIIDADYQPCWRQVTVLESEMLHAIDHVAEWMGQLPFQMRKGFMQMRVIRLALRMEAKMIDAPTTLSPESRRFIMRRWHEIQEMCKDRLNSRNYWNSEQFRQDVWELMDDIERRLELGSRTWTNDELTGADVVLILRRLTRHCNDYTPTGHLLSFPFLKEDAFGTPLGDAWDRLVIEASKHALLEPYDIPLDVYETARQLTLEFTELRMSYWKANAVNKIPPLLQAIEWARPAVNTVYTVLDWLRRTDKKVDKTMAALMALIGQLRCRESDPLSVEAALKLLVKSAEEEARVNPNACDVPTRVDGYEKAVEEPVFPTNPEQRMSPETLLQTITNAMNAHPKVLVMVHGLFAETFENFRPTELSDMDSAQADAFIAEVKCLITACEGGKPAGIVYSLLRIGVMRWKHVPTLCTEVVPSAVVDVVRKHIADIPHLEKSTKLFEETFYAFSSRELARMEEKDAGLSSETIYNIHTIMEQWSENVALGTIVAALLKIKTRRLRLGFLLYDTKTVAEPVKEAETEEKQEEEGKWKEGRKPLPPPTDEEQLHQEMYDWTDSDGDDDSDEEEQHSEAASISDGEEREEETKDEPAEDEEAPEDEAKAEPEPEPAAETGNDHVVVPEPEPVVEDVPAEKEEPLPSLVVEQDTLKEVLIVVDEKMPDPTLRKRIIEAMEGITEKELQLHDDDGLSVRSRWQYVHAMICAHVDCKDKEPCRMMPEESHSIREYLTEISLLRAGKTIGVAASHSEAELVPIGMFKYNLTKLKANKIVASAFCVSTQGLTKKEVLKNPSVGTGWRNLFADWVNEHIRCKDCVFQVTDPSNPSIQSFVERCAKLLLARLTAWLAHKKLEKLSKFLLVHMQRTGLSDEDTDVFRYTLGLVTPELTENIDVTLAYIKLLSVMSDLLLKPSGYFAGAGKVVMVTAHKFALFNEFASFTAALGEDASRKVMSYKSLFSAPESATPRITVKKVVSIPIFPIPGDKSEKKEEDDGALKDIFSFMMGAMSRKDTEQEKERKKNRTVFEEFDEEAEWFTLPLIDMDLPKDVTSLFLEAAKGLGKDNINEESTDGKELRSLMEKAARQIMQWMDMCKACNTDNLAKAYVDGSMDSYEQAIRDFRSLLQRIIDLRPKRQPLPASLANNHRLVKVLKLIFYFKVNGNKSRFSAEHDDETRTRVIKQLLASYDFKQAGHSDKYGDVMRCVGLLMEDVLKRDAFYIGCVLLDMCGWKPSVAHKGMWRTIAKQYVKETEHIETIIDFGKACCMHPERTPMMYAGMLATLEDMEQCPTSWAVRLPRLISEAERLLRD